MGRLVYGILAVGSPVRSCEGARPREGPVKLLLWSDGRSSRSAVEGLVSHSPPQGTLDVSSRGDSLWSVVVREAMDANSPKVPVCGHIHDSAGRCEQAGETTVVNAGLSGMIVES